MSPRRPPDEPKDRALDEVLIAPPEDLDPPDDRPGQKSADPKDDPSSSKSPKKAPSRKRFRLAQDPGGPVEAPGEPTLLNDEAPMNALSPAKAKTAKPSTTKATLPQRVTKPEVQRHHNLSATVVRGPKVEHGEVRWYWRIDRCANAALGVTERETVYHKWATVTEAQSELADLVIRGAHRPQVAVGVRRIVTFADLIDADAVARGEPAHLSQRTIDSWVARRRWLKGLLGHKVILQTSKDELERLLIAQIQGGRAYNTVSTAAYMLVGIWRRAHDERLITIKPPRIQLGRSLRERKPTPTRDEILTIVNSLTGEAKLVVQVLAVTGARIGEITSLRRCDYDPRSHCLTVNGKTGPRRVPMDESVRAQLAERADGTTAPMFQWTTKRQSSVQHGDGWARRVIASACRRLGLRSFSPHGLRRAAVNFFIDQGYDVKVIATFLGHSVGVLLEHYRTPTHETVERMVTSARPGDFSKASPILRRALDILPELLKDADLMADPCRREALTVLLIGIGQQVSGVNERAEAAELAEVVPHDRGANQLVADGPPTILHVRSAPPTTTSAPPSAAGRASPPRRHPAPSQPAKPNVHLSQPATTPERPPSLPLAASQRPAPSAPGQRSSPGASAVARPEDQGIAPADVSTRRPAPLVSSLQPNRGPSRALQDKLAKG